MQQHHFLDRLHVDQIMATSKITKMQAKEEEMTVQEAVKEITEIELEEDVEDPLEGMTNAEIADIYKKLKWEDRRLFRQFKHFHKTYYNLHGHNTPSHQLARGIVSEIFSGPPAQETDTIANAHAKILAAELLKDLCKQLGLAIPVELQMYKAPEVPEYPPPPPPSSFPVMTGQRVAGHPRRVTATSSWEGGREAWY